jgi:hypothetical protein
MKRTMREQNRQINQAREKWVSESHFHEMNQEQVLSEVARRAKEKKNSWVLLDLDSTLYEVGSRSFQILKEWANSEESSSFRGEREAIFEMKSEVLGYSVQDTFSNLGLVGSEALISAKAFWQSRFFTNHYLQFDCAYPGAAQFAKELHALGAHVVYLTGRDEINMGDGTRRNLERDGFPWNVSRTHLLMKPYFELGDLDYKKVAAKYVERNGELIASFENEPPNVVALSEILPQTMHIFVDTVCSSQTAMPGKGLYRIEGFC